MTQKWKAPFVFKLSPLVCLSYTNAWPKRNRISHASEAHEKDDFWAIENQFVQASGIERFYIYEPSRWIQSFRGKWFTRIYPACSARLFWLPFLTMYVLQDEWQIKGASWTNNRTFPISVICATEYEWHQLENLFNWSKDGLNTFFIFERCSFNIDQYRFPVKSC